MAGCETLRRREALLIFNSSAAARKYLKCRSSMIQSYNNKTWLTTKKSMGRFREKRPKVKP
jgi:hypothetical protein